MKILVPGGCGFVGSHVVETFANEGEEVIALDNFSRSSILKSAERSRKAKMHNYNYLKKLKEKKGLKIEFVKGDIRKMKDLEGIGKVDGIIHTAAQVAVTSSLEDPFTDFSINALGTLNLLEHARKSNASFIYCSTNKVYGDNGNKLELEEKEKRYSYKNAKGISEEFSIDLCEHTPYGCSKLTGDLYVQDYGHLYGMHTGIFRMSCQYGPRQFGNEDQGWVAHFVFNTVRGKDITIYGDGKQVRDLLYASDLVAIYKAFLNNKSLKGEVFNTGGGPNNTISLLELLDLLEKLTGKRSKITFSSWRPSDQKVYISNIDKAKRVLNWEPKVGVEEGVGKLVEWAKTI